MNMSDTSAIAADSIRGLAENLRVEVLKHITEAGDAGRTCDEIEVIMGAKHQTISARITELKKLHSVFDSGNRRKTRSYRPARVYLPCSPYLQRLADASRR